MAARGGTEALRAWTQREKKLPGTKRPVDEKVNISVLSTQLQDDPNRTDGAMASRAW
jgi:hypothetical protein